MDNGETTRPMTRADTRRIARHALEQRSQMPVLLDSVQNDDGGDPGYIRTAPTAAACVAAKLALRYCVLSLSEAANTVGRTIRGYWSSIISTQVRKNTQSADLSLEDTSGLVISYNVKFENVVYSAPTATESTLPPSKEAMLTKTSKVLCAKSTETLESSLDFKRIRDGLNDGTLDLSTISVQDWLEVTFLSMYGGDEVHIDTSIVDRGCVYHLHMCVQGVVPPGQQVKQLKNKV